MWKFNRLIGSITVTVPTCYYLAQQTPKADHGHSEHGHGHDEEHEKEGEDEHEEDSAESKTEDSEKPEESADDSSEESTEGSKHADSGNQKQESSEENSGEESDGSSDGGEKQQDTPATSDDEGSENTAHEVGGGNDVEGVRFKGATKGGTKDGEQGDTRKHIPDAKGYNKKRIESDYGMKQGQVADESADDGSGPDDQVQFGKLYLRKSIDIAFFLQPAASKTPKSMNFTSGKQEGLSNTDTKHSTDITNNPEKSTKGEGTPETSKTKGTVDPNRPQV